MTPLQCCAFDRVLHVFSMSVVNSNLFRLSQLLLRLLDVSPTSVNAVLLAMQYLSLLMTLVLLSGAVESIIRYPFLWPATTRLLIASD
jgi:hypothetical protein